jgi:hypothetical protein
MFFCYMLQRFFFKCIGGVYAVAATGAGAGTAALAK